MHTNWLHLYMRGEIERERNNNGISGKWLVVGWGLLAVRK